MSKVLKLEITKTDVRRRQEAREILQDAMDDKQVEAVFVVRIRADRTWAWETAGNLPLTEILGKIEIAKHEMIAKYSRDK